MVFQASEVQDYVVAQRRRFHMHPELGLKEYETSAHIRAELDAQGIPYRRYGETGIVAEIQGGRAGENAPCVLLRADMDALPVQEESGCPFASQVPNVMHACGHDGHTAMLMGAARLLWRSREELPGRVRLVFEPAEEFGGAGRDLIAAGILEGVDTVFAIHVMPDLEAGHISVQPGPRMAGVGGLNAKVHGVGGHAAMPHQSVDALLAAAQAVVSLQSFVSREVDANDAVVVSVTKFHAGTTGNVIPETVEFGGCVRYFDLNLGPKLRDSLTRIIQHTAAAYRATAEVEVSLLGDPCISDEACSAVARRAAEKVMGPQAVVLKRPVLTSDDFGEYLSRRPGVYAFLGVMNREKDACYPLHHPRFQMDEDVLGQGSAVYAQYAWEYCAGRSAEEGAGRS